ncbi:MAG: hypothetical protein NT161_01870 [Candidatus Nomurabacteria bacterium]|nr:hypothetical protein [Candidatus Nomurabacteria bacterium]
MWYTWEVINKKEKKITNVELLQSINRSFFKIEAKMATKEDLKNLEEKMSGKFEGVNKRIDDMSVNRVKYEDHNKLKARMDFVEKKLEIN